MKKNNISKKTIVLISIILAILLFLAFFNQTLGMTHYQETDFVTGLVTASALNVRAGPGKTYKSIGLVYKNEYIRVFARIGNWYVIQTDQDLIGAVSVDYVKPIYPSGNTNTNNSSGANQETSDKHGSTELTQDEKEVFDLINQQRTSAGLSALVIDDELQNVARIKAKDMVDSSYFSHTSPTYGSPFDMIKNFGITYKTAGENIAGNSSNQGAVNAWMNSEGHKANILNNAYNYTGIAVVSSPKYGKIYVQMFMGK